MVGQYVLITFMQDKHNHNHKNFFFLLYKYI